MCYNVRCKKYKKGLARRTKASRTGTGGRQELKMAKKKLSKEKSIRRTKHLTEIAVCAVILTVGAFMLKGAIDRSVTIPTTDTRSQEEVTVPDTTEPVTEEFDPSQLIFENISVNSKDKFKGDLILVNNYHQYYATGEEDLVSILTLNDERDIHYFGSVDYDYTILRPAYEAMVKMIGDFYDKYHYDNLIIYGSYRTTDFQRQLYEADLADTGKDSSTRVAKPGFSEHESGYAFDFTTTPDYDFNGEGDYGWFAENCWKYGYILRYPKNKEHKTEIQYEPWHFRYCGVPHAYYMSKNDQCLEEYLDMLEKEHPYTGEHLEFTDENGQAYEIYFVPSDDGEAQITSVPVPAGQKYEISGNNYSGFIVTVYKDAQTSEEPASAAQAENETQSETETSAEESESSENE